MSALRVARLNFLHWRGDHKYWVTILYLLLYSFERLYDLGRYASFLGVSIAPWAFPFMPCMGASFLPFMLGFVLLICDVPFRTRQQRFVMQRTGKRVWLTGQLLYILAASVAFTLMIWVLSWIWFLPDLEWSGDWGAFFRNVAMNSVPGEYSVYMSFPYSLIRSGAPLRVTLWCMGSMIAVCFLLGVMMAACNLWLRKGSGAVLVAMLTAICLILDANAQNPGPIRYILWVSPLNWMNYSLMGHSEQYLPAHSYGIVCPALLGGALGIVLLLTIGKCNVETDKE